MGRKKNVIAPNDERAVMAMDKMASDIEKARELYGDGQPFDEERVLDCIVFRAERSAEELFQFGRYCLWLKAEIGHGGYLKALARRNLNVRAADWASLIYEKMGSNSTTLSNLGTSKARYIAYFSKEEIDKYAQGGDLGNISHDDVADMTVRELEAEVRKLRQKVKSVESVGKEKIRQKDEQITKMEFEIENCRHLSEKEIAAKINEPKLKELHDDLFANIHCIITNFEKAIKNVIDAMQLKGVTYPQLAEWRDREYEKLATINELFERLDHELVNIHVDKGDDK